MSAAKIVWIDEPLVLAIHDRQLAEHGGPPGGRDESLLDSALAGPLQLHAHGSPPPDLASLAASLAFGLVRDHPFLDGNKRTAHVYYRVFLVLNDLVLAASDEDKYVTILALAEGALTEAAFADWVRRHIQPISGKLHESRRRYRRRATR